MMDLEGVGIALHTTALSKGFWPGHGDRTADTYVAKLMMITTEVAEIVEAYRKQQGPDRISDEFADLFIRALDLYEAMVEDGLVEKKLEDAILEKADINKTRPKMHGNLI